MTIDEYLDYQPLIPGIEIVEGNENAFLLIHGMGAPHEFKEFSSILLKKRFDVYAPVIYGYASKEKLKKAFYTEQISILEKIVVDLTKNYASIHTVGVSAGALMSLYLSFSYDFGSVTLINPPIYVPIKALEWLPSLQILEFLSVFSDRVPHIGKTELEKYRDNPIMEEADKLKVIPEYYNKAISTLYLLKKVRPHMDKCKSPLLVIASKKGFLSPEESARYIFNRASTKKRLVIIDTVEHNLMITPSRYLVYTEILNWAKNLYIS